MVASLRSQILRIASIRQVDSRNDEAGTDCHDSLTQNLAMTESGRVATIHIANKSKSK